MVEVFVSYSQKDRALVAPVSLRLAELGVEAWIDQEIGAGQSFGAIIRERLREAKAVIVCWSPNAVKSQWVDAEADFARELGTYIPVFVAPCPLLPPFNRIHTDDLSKWSGAANDPVWLKLIERLGAMLGREGLGGAARALTTDDEATRYDFARRHPDEPLARTIWAAAEARHREAFEKSLGEARLAVAAKLTTERATLEARLAAALPVFEAWLAEERRGSAKGSRPDPSGLVEPADDDEARSLRREIAALSNALTQSKAGERELASARDEVERLSSELAGERAAAAAHVATIAEAATQRDAQDRQIREAQDKIERLTGELKLAQDAFAAAQRVKQPPPRARAAAAAAVAVAGLCVALAIGAFWGIAEEGKLSDAKTALADALHDVTALKTRLDEQAKTSTSLQNSLENSLAKSATNCQGSVIFADTFLKYKLDWSPSSNVLSGLLPSVDGSKLNLSIDDPAYLKRIDLSNKGKANRICVMIDFPNRNYAGDINKLNPEAGIYFLRDNKGYYMVRIMPQLDKIYLYKFAYGSDSKSLASSSLSSSDAKKTEILSPFAEELTFNLNVYANGSNIFIFIDNTLKITYPSALTLDDSIGLFAHADQKTTISFRDFVMTKD